MKDTSHFDRVTDHAVENDIWANDETAQAYRKLFTEAA
jgi:hypothetical protein